MALIASSMDILGRDDLFFREKEEKTLGRDEGRGDKNGHLLLVFEIGQLICQKSKNEISFLWEFDKDGLTKGTFSSRRECIGQLFGGGIDILYNWDSREEVVSPTDQLTAQNIGGDHSDQVEQEEKTDDP